MNKKNKIYVGTLGILSISFLVGCSDIKNNLNLDKYSIVSTIELLNTKENNEFYKYKNRVLDYNIGNIDLGEEDKSINVELKGTIGVPKNLDNSPIVFILSGNNNLSKESADTYQGLNYLVDALSKSGFLTIAINTDLIIDKKQEDYVAEDKILNQVFDEHYKHLEKAIKGEESKYPISLYKKGDIRNVGLIGQSNTGKTIYSIANQQISNNTNNIKGLLSITPCSKTAITSYPDIASSILLAEHSLDTSSGFDMYNDIEKSKGRKSFSQLTYLIGGNSDKFNSSLKEDTLSRSVSKISDTIDSLTTSASTNEDTIQDDLSHEEFLVAYAVDFFDYIFGTNNSSKNSLYNTKSATIQKLYGKEVLSKLYVSDTKSLFDVRDDKIISLVNMKSKNVIESSISTMDTAIDFNEPSTNIKLNLLQLDWKSENASISIPIKDIKDFEEYDSLSIQWALNHASELNKEDIDKISLILEDEKGKKSEVVLLDELPLNRINGESKIKVINNKSISTWSRFTPIAETRVPLKLFEGIDLQKITKITINFKDNKSGSFYLKDICLKK